MSNQDDHSNQNNQPQSSTDSDDPVENIAGNFKTLSISIGGVVLILSILVLLPMFLTYLSEGDYRAPSETHTTDAERKNGQNNYL